MVAPEHRTVRCRRRRFSYSDACRIASRAARCLGSVELDLDFTDAAEVTTAALARLVILRRALIQRQADLRLMGLHGYALAVYNLSRLDRVLPQRCDVNDRGN